MTRHHHRLLVLSRLTSYLGGILDVEAGHLAVVKTEEVSHRFVSQPVCLALKWLAFEIADGLSNFRDDRAVRSPVEAHRLDVRTDHGPLASPVLAHGLAAVNVAAVHAIGPRNIIGRTASTPSMSRTLKRS